MRLARLLAAASGAVALLTAPGLSNAQGDPQPDPPVPLPPEAYEPTEADRERAARHSLEDARSFRLQGRLEAAERAARRGLRFQPHHSRLHRFLARLLAEQGRADEAEALHRRADVLDPPPPPPPDEPLQGSSRGLVVLLLAPGSDNPDPARVPAEWPDPVVAETLERRLRVRLPEARIVHADPRSVRDASAKLESLAARTAFSLRIARAYCDWSVKDGPFAVSVLWSAVEVPGGAGPGPERVRAVVDDPASGEECARQAVARALEEALSRPSVGWALATQPAPAASWSRESIRTLFPGLGSRIREALDEGLRWLGSGHLVLAEESFERAARIDPADPEVLTYLAEVVSTLALVGQLGDPEGDGNHLKLQPRFSDQQRAAAEAQLADERRRRDDLLAVLAVLDEDVRPPRAETLERLRPATIRDPNAFGVRRARARAGGPVEARVAYAPDGSVLSRYYFPVGGAEPVLREEDTSDDGRADRWITYAAGARHEILEDGDGRGRPDVRIVFAPGGSELERIELDPNLDGRPNHAFQYVNGRLRVEARDTNDDGRLDRFDRFDDRGRVVMQEEDRNADGRIDVRSIYRAGKLVRREFSDPDHVPDDT